MRFAVVFPIIELTAIWALSLVPGKVAGFVEGVGTTFCVPFWPASIALIDRAFTWHDAPLIAVAVASNLLWWALIAFALIGLRRLRRPRVSL